MSKVPRPRIVPLRFEEKFRQHLDLNDGSQLATLLQNSQVFVIIAGLVEAFLRQPPKDERLLEEQRERGRRRKQAIPKAVKALIEAAACYSALEGLESLHPDLAERLLQEAFRLLLKLDRWDEIHDERRFGGKNWFFLVTLQDFLKIWSERAGQQPYQVTTGDLLRLVTAGDRALGWHQQQGAAPRLPTADDLRGLAHFRKNPKNKQLCELAAGYAYYLASHAHLRPLLILRNEN